MATNRSTQGGNDAGDGQDQTSESLAAAEAAIKEGLDEANRYLQRQLTERPLTVAATALGVGVLVGVLLGSRRS
ncbi:MAG: hypothetical protein H7124_10125 [Phycisphaerales bacterium]|nr:hypothetical protein [Hyphomonadaceae bacterium]